MRQKSTYLKIAADLFLVQSMWSLWALGIILFIYIIRIIAAITSGSEMEDFLTSYYPSANIYMLVIGIISAIGMLPYFVGNGATRKDYFKGGAIAFLGVAIFITILFGIITGLEYAVGNIMNLPLVVDSIPGTHFREVTSDGIISSLVLTIVDSPFVSLTSNWLLSLFVLCVNLCTYYVIGWMIGSAYYRFGGLGSFGFIILPMVFLTIRDLLWGRELGGLLLANLLPLISIAAPFWASAAGAIVIIGAALWFIRLLTSRVAIKM